MIANSMKTKIYILILSVLFCSVFSQRAGFGQAVQTLSGFQATEDGGFVGADGTSSARATADALLLASLYGVKSRVDSESAIKYLRSLENSDYGYGQTADLPSDIESTRQALIALEALGVKTSNPSKTEAYIQSLADKSSGLFANRVGDKPNIESTAFALQALKILGDLEDRWVVDLIPRLNEYLGSILVGDSAFSADTSENYYAIVVGAITGFDAITSDPLKFAQHVGSLQHPQNGLFYDNAVTRAQPSLVASCDAMLSLYILDGVARNPPSRRYTDAVNVNNLRNSLRYLSPDLSTAAHAHLALAVTRAFKDNFQVVASLHGAEQDTVLEGTDVTPLVSVLFRDGNVPHEGFSVSSRSLFHGAAETAGKLKYSKENRGYIGEVISTLGKYGPVQVLYSLVNHIPGLGSIVFDIPETKSVGYGIEVKSTAFVDQTGREVKEGETVTVGTTFDFSVTLRTLQNADYFSGDFIVTFSVLDASNVVIQQETIDGATNKKPIAFHYTLQTPAIPSGSLSFAFDVSTKDGGVRHTSKSVVYQYSTSMLASHISFEGKKDISSFKLGETIKVTMEAATYPDLHNVYPLDAPLFSDLSTSLDRHFFLDVRSPAGTLIQSYPATSATGAKYTFKFTPEPHLKFLNKNAISFRYKPVNGADVELDNYDATSDEVMEEEIEFAYKTDLHVVDVQEKPAEGALAFGSDVVFRFKIQDKVSGMNVVGSNGSYAAAYLTLQHNDEGRSYTSLSIPAHPTSTIKGDVYHVARWTVNPNAYNGDSVLTIVAKDSEGKTIPLKETQAIKVNIGGDITVKEEVFTTSSLDTTHAAFVAELGIMSGNRSLENANLRARVTYVEGRKQEHIATIPVAHNKGRYTVSWIASLVGARSGDYKLDFFREVDRVRALEKQNANELKLKKERQAKGEVEPSSSPSPSEVVVEPIFSVTLPYTAPVTSLPVKAEFIALIFFGSVVGWLISQRTNLK